MVSADLDFETDWKAQFLSVPQSCIRRTALNLGFGRFSKLQQQQRRSILVRLPELYTFSGRALKNLPNREATIALRKHSLSGEHKPTSAVTVGALFRFCLDLASTVCPCTKLWCKIAIDGKVGVVERAAAAVRTGIDWRGTVCDPVCEPTELLVVWNVAEVNSPLFQREILDEVSINLPRHRPSWCLDPHYDRPIIRILSIHPASRRICQHCQRTREKTKTILPPVGVVCKHFILARLARKTGANAVPESAEARRPVHVRSWLRVSVDGAKRRRSQPRSGGWGGGLV
jgi:hypothetical protein